MKLKMSKCKFHKCEIEILGHVLSGKGIFPMKQNVKTITDLALIINTTETRHIIGLVGFWKFIPLFSDMK